MPSFSEVYNRSGRQAIQDIYNLFNNLNQQRQQREFYNTILNAYGDFNKRQQEINNQTVQSNLNLQPQMTNVPNNINNLNLQPNRQQSPLSLRMNIPSENATQRLRLAPTITQTPTTSREKYSASQSNYNQLMNQLIPLLVNQQTNENQLARASLLGQLAGEQVSRYAPKYQTVKENEGVIDLTTGEYIIKPTKETPKNWKTAERLINGKPFQILYDPDTYNPNDPSTYRIIGQSYKAPIISGGETKAEKEAVIRANEFLNNIQSNEPGGWGRILTPQELKGEVNKHYKAGRFNKETKDVLEKYIKDYSDKVRDEERKQSYKEKQPKYHWISNADLQQLGQEDFINEKYGGAWFNENNKFVSYENPNKKKEQTIKPGIKEQNIPQEAIDELLSDPSDKNIKYFDEIFGEGSANQYLGK